MGKNSRIRHARLAEPAPAPASARRERSPLLLVAGALVVIAVVAVFAQTGSFPFLNLDDPQYVTQNPQVLRGLTLENVRWAFTGTAAGYWLPVTFLSHMADVEMFGTRAGGHHTVNVAIHAAASVLLFLALASMTGRVWASLFVALLFGIHPLRAESVAWVAERKDVLTAFFWCAGMIAWSAWCRRPTSARYLAVLALFAAGLMAKPMMITFPFALMLLDLWPLGRVQQKGWRGIVVEKIPLLALIPLSAWATFVAQKQWGAVRTLDEMSLPLRLGNAVLSYVTYLGKTFWPSSLSFFYPWERPNLIAVVAALLLLAAITAVAFRSRSTRPYLLMGWLWFLGTLVPVIGIVQAGEQARADRFTYLPHVGLFVALVWGLSEAADRLSIPKGLRVAGAVAAVIALMIAAGKYTRTFDSSISAWQNAIAVAEHPTSDMHLSLAIAYAENGRVAEALEENRKAAELDPRSFTARAGYAATLKAAGDFARAAQELEAAATIDPAVADVHNNLGNAYDRLGDDDRALAEYREAIRLDPRLAEAHMNLATLLSRKGDATGALDHYGRALALQPESIEARIYFALALWNGGERPRAVAELQRAGERDPAKANSLVTKALRMEPHPGNLEQLLRDLRAQL